MAKVIGVGHALPDQIVTNDDLTRFMETSDSWIQQRSGIRERRWSRRGFEASGGPGNFDLARSAAEGALQMAGVRGTDVDGIFYATISPDREFPGSGAWLQRALCCPKGVPVFEIRNHCSGFLYGLLLAKTYLDVGAMERAILVGVELQSTGIDLSTRGRSTAVLFGDGAGALVLNADKPGIIDVILASDGAYAENLGIEAPSFARPVPITVADFEAEPVRTMPRMDGGLIFKMASQKIPEVVRQILAKNHLTIADISLIVPHQANQRILDMVGRELGASDRIFSNIARYGNTTAATIPLALSVALVEGRIKSGDLICLATFGAGFSWGAALLRW